MISISVKVSVDFPGIESKIRAAAANGTRKLAAAAHNEWQSEAGRRLNTTRRRYQDALRLTQVSDTKATIHLEASDKGTQWLVNALEFGVESFDMKPKRLSGHASTHWSAMHKTLSGEKKKPGQPYYQPTPFVDIPVERSGKEGRSTKFRRMHSKSTGWIHPGFKPKGTGGPGPMRPHVVEYIKTEAQKVFQSEFDKAFRE